MNIELHNSWEYEKDDWWAWSAYLIGAGLDKIDHVEYVLHPSFKTPVRNIADPANGFRLDSSGWGTFPLTAIVHFKDGTQRVLKHELQLGYTPKKGRSDAAT